MTFRYFITLKEGYKIASPLFEGKETEMEITLEAQNRATADRMMKALLSGNNVTEYDGIAIS